MRTALTVMRTVLDVVLAKPAQRARSWCRYPPESASCPAPR